MVARGATPAVLLALLVALVYVLLIYPRLATPTNAVLDPDGYGALGEGLWRTGRLVYYPDPEPTLNRGPLYPALIAIALAASGGRWPLSIQLVQVALFALTVLATFRLAADLAGGSGRAAALAAGLAALHPLLIWYTSRVWIETLATLTFTLIALTLVRLARRPDGARALIAGLLLGLGALIKGTFLVPLVAAPLLLWHRSRRGALLALVVALTLLLPWTARNWRLSGELVPVHALGGFNVQWGDRYALHYFESPLSYRALRATGWPEVDAIVAGRLPESAPAWRWQLTYDALALADSVGRYRARPQFLLQKIGLNAVMFWTLGETPLKSVLISMLQLPLLAAFLTAVLRRGAREPWGAEGIPPALVALYFGAHLPVFAFARLGVVLVPTMLACAAAWLVPPAPADEAR